MNKIKIWYHFGYKKTFSYPLVLWPKWQLGQISGDGLWLKHIQNRRKNWLIDFSCSNECTPYEDLKFPFKTLFAIIYWQLTRKSIKNLPHIVCSNMINCIKRNLIFFIWLIANVRARVYKSLSKKYKKNYTGVRKGSEWDWFQR